MGNDRKNTNKQIKWVRSVILFLFLAFVTYEAYRHNAIGGGSDGAPSIHALCPFGALESLYLILFRGTMIQRIFMGTFVLLGITVLLAIIYRRSFCGLICPFGALQEFFGKIGQVIFKKKYTINSKIDGYLRYFKYVVLLITVLAAWKTSTLWMTPYDPWSAYGHLSGGLTEILEEGLIGLIILVITLLGSMLYDRFFCKYMCPMGAFLGIISKISPNTIKRNAESCIDCGICNKVCPVNIKVSEIEELKTVECLNCQLCTLSCPVEGTLENKWRKKTIKPGLLIVLVLALYFGGVVVAKAWGVYAMLPPAITAESTITAEDIKGYMSLEDVALGTKIELSVLYQQLNITDEIPSDIKMKDIKTILPEFEVDAVREIVRSIQ